jgi:hypothetical protein
MWMQQSDSTTRFYCHLLQLTLAPEADAYDAGSPDGAASPRRRRLREGQWELFIFIYFLGGREKSLYYAFRLTSISCQQRLRLGTRPGGLGNLKSQITRVTV